MRDALAILVGTTLLLVAPAAFAEASENADTTRRYALIVANNDSVDTDVESLEYADDDGARYFEMFDSLTDETRLLTTLDVDSQRIFPEIAQRTVPPSRRQLERAVDELATEIAADREADRRAELYLVFTGHGAVDDSGQGYLSLMNSKLHRDDLYREIIEPLNADYTHLIVDACHAYFMVHSRGAGDGEWRDDRSGRTLDDQLNAYLAEGESENDQTRPTVGVVVSTAGNAEVHEWSRYRAGVFSHQLRSGLLGAADADGDGAIAYGELEAYLVAANAAVTNPRARINVYAHPPAQDRSRPLAALDQFDQSTILEIPAGAGGRYHLEDARGLRYADFHVDGTSPTRIALLRKPVDGGYYLVRDDEQAKIRLAGLTVRSNELAFHQRSQQARGSVDEAFRSDLFSTPFGPSFVEGFEAGRQSASRRVAPPQNDTANDHWHLEGSLSYGISPTLPLRGAETDRYPPEHRALATAIFRHTSGWGLGPFVGYGGSFFAAGRQQHRLAGGLEASRRFDLAPAVGLLPALNVGHTGFLVADDTLRSDPVGFHAGVSVTVDWQISERLSLFARPGLAADLYTLDNGEAANLEKWFLTPVGRIGVTLR